MRLHYIARPEKSKQQLWLEVIAVYFDLQGDDPRTTDSGIALAQFRDTAAALDFAVQQATGLRPPHNIYYHENGEPAVILTDAEPEFAAGGQLHVTISADPSRTGRTPAAVIVRPVPAPYG